MKIGSVLTAPLFSVALFCAALAPLTLKAEDLQNRQLQQNQQDQQNQQACMGDAMTFCGQFIPDRERVARCLMSNRRRISPACRVALMHFK